MSKGTVADLDTASEEKSRFEGLSLLNVPIYCNSSTVSRTFTSSNRYHIFGRVWARLRATFDPREFKGHVSIARGGEPGDEAIWALSMG